MAKNLKSEAVEEKVDGAGLRFGIVVSRFNSAVTERLLKGAQEALRGAGAAEKDIEVVQVPGAFELPLAAKKLAMKGEYDALIAIGCVIRGETSHYDYVCSETARGLQLAQMDTGVPVMFCVLTCETQEQALARAGGKSGNKGFDCGVGAVEMARLSRKLEGKVVKKATAGKRRRA
ncbi:MAG TPA: 6,7-dimethyl-8-ribityllumazine synthase [Candidatus Acidoferrum sp.]|jgi:6,7-dimethyl-8-ribityllumazine synthase